MNIDFILRLATLVLLVVWRAYWFLTAKNSEVKKPKTDFDIKTIELIFINIGAIYIFINLIGLKFFYFNNNLFQVAGFGLAVFGFIEAIVARKILGDNWTESFEYQIKKNHELITKGIYKYVRHPIYGGLMMMAPGALLVSGSYTFIIGLVLMVIAAEIFARREEKLLTKHFGKKYIDYMKMTKKFIPLVY